MEYVESFRNYILELYPDALELLAQGYQIDRIDNDSGYQPGNIRLVSSKTNIRNRRNSQMYAGVNVNYLYEEVTNPIVSSGTFRSRLSRGWSLECALNRPLQYRRHSGDIRCSSESCVACHSIRPEVRSPRI